MSHRIALFLLLVTAPAAVSAELPIAQVYGNDAACELYIQGGTEAVFLPEIATSFPDQIGTDDYMLVTPRSVVSLESYCEPSDTPDGSINLSCSGEGIDWTEQVIVSIDPQTSALTYQDSERSVTLHPCPSDVDATM